MVIAGAGGHARELAGILLNSDKVKKLCFFDNINQESITHIWNRYPILRSEKELQAWLAEDPAFALGIGSPKGRKELFDYFLQMGGKPESVIDPSAFIGQMEASLGRGLNIMNHAFISQDTRIGDGTLVHVFSSIHHDCKIGAFCELSPGCRILGRATIGNEVSVGSNAVIFPGIEIGDWAVIGAGAVVTRNVPNGRVVKGIPAK